MLQYCYKYNVCVANKNAEETSFVSHIIYVSICSILYSSEILFTTSASKIELACNLLVQM